MKSTTVTEQDVWPALSDSMYPDLSVTVETPNPTPTLVTITMSAEYAARLLRALEKARESNYNQEADASILQRLLEHALKG